MKRLCAALIVLSLTSPALAEEDQTTDLLKQFEELSENAQTLLDGWISDLGPKLEELGPTLEGFAEQLGDLSAYHPPEILENGDIIIRRKTPTEPEPETDPDAENAPVKDPIDL